MKTISLSLRNFKEIYRDPVSISLGLALPVGFLLIFDTLQKSLPLEIFKAQYLAPAMAIFGFAFLIMFSATLLNKDRESAFLTRLLSAPLKSSNFITAYFLPYIPFVLVQIIICLIAGIILGADYKNILASLLIFLPLSLACIGIGITMGATLTTVQISGLGQF